MSAPRFEIVEIAGLESLPGPGTLRWTPLRRRLGFTAVGINAYTASDAGQDVVEEHTEGTLDVAGRHLDVARVDHPQVLEAVGPQRQRGPRAVVRQVVGHPDGLRAEPRARPVRRTPVEGRTDHDDVRTRVGGLVVEVAGGHAQEGDVGTELSAVASHGETLGPAGGDVSRAGRS